MAIQLDGEDGISMSEFRQGFLTMNEPCKAFEKEIISKSINQLDHPVLRWCIGNMMVAQDSAGNFKPDKKRSADKIDGAVSAIMAHGLHLLKDTQDPTSIYEEQGLISLG